MSRSPAVRRTSSSPQPPEQRRESGCRRIELPASATMSRAEPIDLDRDVDLDHFEVDLDPAHVERPLDLDLEVALPAADRLPSFGESSIDVEPPETVPTIAPDAERAARNAAVLFFVLLSACAIAAGVVAAFLFP
jgi:hypothetical protein